MGLTNIPKNISVNYLQENTQQNSTKQKMYRQKKLIQGNNLQETGRNLRFQREKMNYNADSFLFLEKEDPKPSVLVYLHLQINKNVLRFNKNLQISCT